MVIYGYLKGIHLYPKGTEDKQAKQLSAGS